MVTSGVQRALAEIPSFPPSLLVRLRHLSVLADGGGSPPRAAISQVAPLSAGSQAAFASILAGGAAPAVARQPVFSPLQAMALRMPPAQALLSPPPSQAPVVPLSAADPGELGSSPDAAGGALSAAATALAARTSSRAKKPSEKAAARQEALALAEPESAAFVMPTELGSSCYWFSWQSRSPLELDFVVAALQAAFGGAMLPAGWIVSPSKEAAGLAAFALAEADGVSVGAAPEPVMGEPGRLVIKDLTAAATDDAGLLDCESLLTALIAQTRARATFAAYRNPFLKAVLWLLLRSEPVAPPEPRGVAMYLASLVSERANIGAAVTAQRAINYICGLNDWPLVGSSAMAKIPTDAARRMFAKPTKKSHAFSLELLARLFNSLVPGGLGALDETPASMRACAYVFTFVNVNRYADSARCQYGDGYLDITADGELPRAEAFVDYQKNDVFYKGLLVTTAQSACALFGGGSAFDVFVAAKTVFKAGPIMRRIKGGRSPALAPPFSMTIKGYEGKSMPAYMLYNDFVSWVRKDLVAAGLTAEEAAAYTAHSFRAGAVTGLAEADVAEPIIMDRAGTTSSGWLAGYHRVSVQKRCQASQALGV